MSLVLEATLKGHEGSVWCATWSSNGLLATCGVDRVVRIWSCDNEASEWKCVTASAKFRRTIRRVCWGSDDRSLAVACFDGVTTILDLSGGVQPTLECAVTLEGHENEVKGVAYSGSGGLLATCSRDRSVWIWEVGVEFEYECIAVLNGHASDIKSVVWHPTMELLVSCGYDESIKIWAEDEDDWFCIETLKSHRDTVWCADFTRDGSRLVSVSADQSIIVWRRDNPHSSVIGGQPRYAVCASAKDVHDGAIYSCSASHDGSLIVTGGEDDAICVTERKHNNNNNSEDSGDDRLNTLVKREDAHTGDVNGVEWKRESNEIFASCGDDGLVRIWRFIKEGEAGTQEAPE